MMPMDIKQILEIVESNLTKSRYSHTLSVQSTAASLAKKYNYSVEKAEISGVLHDCAKCLSDEIMIKECDKYHVMMSDIEKKHPYLLHGKLGAAYAKYQYGITDAQILDAIAFHTTGRPNMTLLEKIIFVADYIEPNRKSTPLMEALRRLAYEDLNKTVFFILEETLRYLKKINKDIDTLTIDSYNYYKIEFGLIDTK